MRHTIHMPEDKGLLYEDITYPAGEHQIRFSDKQASLVDVCSEVRLISRSISITEIALMNDALHQIIGMRNIPVVLVLPYLHYSRADRRFTKNDCFGLATRGRMIDGIGCDQVVTIDVHSSVATRHISNFKNIQPSEIIEEVIDEIGCKDLTILLPDEGSVGRYKFSKEAKVLNCEKQRDAASGILSGFKVPRIETGKVLIVDDICDGGGTFLGIAKQLVCQDCNPTKYLYVTHGIFSKGMSELLRYFTKIFTTNSLKEALDQARVKVYDVEEYLE